MTPLTTAELKAKQISDTIAAKLPVSLAFDAIEDQAQAEHKARLVAWKLSAKSDATKRKAQGA